MTDDKHPNVDPIPERAEPDSEYRFPAHYYSCRNCRAFTITGARLPVRCQFCYSNCNYRWTYWRKEPVKGLTTRVGG